MTEPTRPVGGGAAAAAKPPVEDARGAPRAGEFDRVLEKRQPGPEAGRARREGPSVADHASRGPEAVPGRQGRKDQRGGEGGGGQHEPGGGHQERSEWRALPGDIALPMGLQLARPEVASASGVRVAEMAALVEQIAGRIVQAAEMTLGPEGRAEARFSLDLASYGQAGLQLQRNSDGTLAVRFEAQTAELARVLENSLGELAARLEARGLVLSEIVVRDPDGVTVRLEPGAEEGGADESRREQEEQGRRHRQPAPDAPAEDAEGD